MRRLRTATGLVAVFGSTTLMVWSAVLAPGADAAGTTRQVSTSGNDTGNCVSSPCATLQYAVDQAHSGDTVAVAAGSYAQSVLIEKSLTLSGAGATGSGRTTLSGGDSGDTTIEVNGDESESGVTVTITNLDVSGNSDNKGIQLIDADATIENCVVNNNDSQGIEVVDSSTARITDTTADGNRSGVLLDVRRDTAKTNAAVTDSGDPTATISSSDLSNNQISGIDVEAGDAAVDHSTINDNEDDGAYVWESTLSISTTTLDGNTFAGAEADFQSELTLTDDTVSHSVPSAGEGGPEGGAGVVIDRDGTADIDTSTVYANTGQGILSELGSVTVENSTVSGTVQPTIAGVSTKIADGPSQGGIVVNGEVPDVRASAVSAHAHAHAAARSAKAQDLSFTTTVTGTIVADNSTLADCNGSVIDGGYNLDTDGSCAWSAAGSITKGAPKLGAFRTNGGPTKTLKPAKGSDAIDVIPLGSARCKKSATDQRGVTRPQAAKCDIGAVEANQPPIVISPDALPDGTVGTAYSAHITATGGLGAPYEITLASSSGALPPGLTMAANGTISGTPTQAGTFPITVSVDDPKLKDYTIVITAPGAPSSSPSGPVLSNTGADVTPLTAYGALALLLGALLTIGGLARYAGRHRAH